MSLNGNPVWQYLGSTIYASGTDITTTATSGSPATVTALATTVTVPTGVTKVKITFSGSVNNSNANTYIYFAVWRGAVGSGTLVKGVFKNNVSAGGDDALTFVGLDTPSAGSVTYNIGWYVSANTGVIKAQTTEQVMVLVESC
jgi:hypothetical protein